MNHRSIFGLVLGIGLATQVSTGRAQAERLSFNRDVRPILAANCFACHGLDAKQRQADLRLDTPEGAAESRDGKVVIKPGDPDGSEFWRRIDSHDPEVVMPPPTTKKTLPAQDKQTLRRWIEQGAAYQKHWAFEPPVATEVPAIPNDNWSRNPIDRFILERLKREGLEPRPEANRQTLIRRVAFALTGLPPTPAEIAAFETDRSDRAYEALVDHYFQSPHYGEEMARHWLDVARYADTHGLHLDNERTMWAYRDWVIRAFNRNQPFDQFTIDQLAGDLLPNPDLDQWIATGFNRCNVTTSEGGSIDAEFLYRYAVERTTTMFQTWMGLTGGCAVCHDHKYDPLSTREFYSMYAFFYSAADPAMDGNIRNTNPFLKLPSPEQTAALTRAEAAETQTLTDLLQQIENASYTDPVSISPPTPPEDVTIELLDDDFPFGSRPKNSSRNAADWIIDPPFGAKSGRRVLGLSSSGQFDITVPLALIPVIVPQSAQLEFWLRVDPNYLPEAFAVQFDAAKANRRLVWGDTAALQGDFSQLIVGPIPTAGEWIRISTPLEPLGLAGGERIKSIVLLQKGGRIWVDGLQLVGQMAPAANPLASFRTFWKLSEGGDPGGITEDLRTTLLHGPDKEHTADSETKLLRFYLQHVQDLAHSPVRATRVGWQQAKIERIGIDDSIPGTFVFREIDTPRAARVMLRGQYDKPGEPVEPAVPSVFPRLRSAAAGEPALSRLTRLDLAQWLLSPEHPLTSRVVVNRFWQQLFGTGIVKTSDDFGVQGELPSHPELLDWLAHSYRESGWNTQELIRRILTSATFRQDARATPELLQRDPGNRLLARAARLRFDAEQIRDNALFVSGLISLEMGGRGVKTYQPPNIWEPVGYSDSNTRFYQVDEGTALYRRSIYCFLKRTAPPPFMSNFDAPNREQFCARRERTNTPLQALQLMNDTQHFEAARALAERALREGGQPLDERLMFLYRTVLARFPTAQEQTIVRNAWEQFRRRFHDAPEDVRQVTTVGASQPARDLDQVELAALTMIANLILNLDEAITRP